MEDRIRFRERLPGETDQEYLVAQAAWLKEPVQLPARRPRGRPVTGARDKHLDIRLAADELERISLQAQAEHQKPSEWARHVLLDKLE